MSGIGWRLGLAGLLVGLGGWRSPLSAAICPADLSPRIEAILQQDMATRRAHWGIVVAPLEGGAPLLARGADQFFIPASNIKLFTTAAALQHFGPEYRITTTVQAAVVDGATTLYLAGRGDPTLTGADLDALAAQVMGQVNALGAAPGVDRVVLDDSYFQGEAINPNWEWEDLQAGYGTPVNSLMLDGNAVAFQVAPQQVGQPLRITFASPLDAQDWHLENESRTVATTEPETLQLLQDGQRRRLRVVGQLQVGGVPSEEAIATPDPAHRFARHWQRALQGAGLMVRQVQFTAQPPAAPLHVWASDSSPPLAALITTANADSENIYAEALLYHLGRDRPLPNTSTREAGLLAVEDILASLGVDPTGIDQADGAGLTRKNLATPTALVQTLQAMHRSPYAQVYRQSLAVAGVSGTLRNRFRDTPVAGRLQGKSGAISGIAALSGYLDPPHHPPLVFSILVNHFDQPVRTVRPIIDAIVEQVAAVQPCP